ncbi:hypothetical protein GJ496_007933 [Pomphorhynchus laevis]|nr:hypothetical protein GJ496_007933 [Pomphorhynchus laevis]
MSANQTPNVAFADALERAKQIAAKLSQNPVKPADTFSTVPKRSAVDSGDEEPDAKKLANEPEGMHCATLLIRQHSGQSLYDVRHSMSSASSSYVRYSINGLLYFLAIGWS